MSISQEIKNLSDRINVAYEAIAQKGGVIPEVRDTYHLSSSIESIPSGGSTQEWSTVGLRLIGLEYENVYGDDSVIGNLRYWSENDTGVYIAIPGSSQIIGTMSTNGRWGQVIYVPCPADDPRAGTVIDWEVGGCLASDMMIMMSDGTTKRIDELDFEDKVMSLNPYTMELEEDDIVYTDSKENKRQSTMDIWTFDDGTILKTIKPHQFYNVRLGRMEYIANFEIGDEVRKQDGTTIKLASHQVETGDFRHFTLFTKKFNNYFANGVLTGNRESVKWGWKWIEANKNEII